MELLNMRDCQDVKRFVLVSLLSFSVCTQAEFRMSSPTIGAPANPVGSGARAMGAGNAFIAVADDATAVSWNPAGLSQLEKPELSFAWESFWQQTRLNSVSGEPGASGDFSEHWTDINFASAVLPFRLADKHAVVSLSYLKQYNFEKAFTVSYVEDSLVMLGLPAMPTTDRVAQEGEFSTWTLAMAYDIQPKLSFGAAVNLWNDDLTGSSSFSREMYTRYEGDTLGMFGWPNEVEDTSDFTVEHGVSYSFGAMYRPTRAWTFGMVFKPPFDLDIDWEYALNNRYYTFGVLDFVDTDRDAENMTLEFPLELGGGLAWRPSDELTISADVSWRDWSDFNLVRGDGTSINPYSLAGADLEDTFSVRTGLEYLIIKQNHIIPLRCGLAYDPAPAIGQTNDYYTVSLGSGLQWDRYALDISYQYRLGNGVNEDIAFGGANLVENEDVERHRLLASLIIYL